MKVTCFRVQEDEHGKKQLAIQLSAENQREASLLIHATNRFPSTIKAYGRVGEAETWAWILIPLKNVKYNTDYFGNDKL